MQYIDYFILYLLKRFNGERTSSAVYHLLRGKKTSQTIQDGFLFQVHPFFQTLHITRQELNQIVRNLEMKKLVIEQDVDHYVLTSIGEKKLNDLEKEFFIPKGLNGWFYGGRARLFWQRLSLLVQTLSYLDNGKTKFYPISRNDDIQAWVKQLLLSAKMNRKEILLQVRRELDMLLEKLPDIEATLLTHRLSGFNCDGLSMAQLCAMTRKSETEITLLLQSGLHRSVQYLAENNQMRVLNHLLDKNKEAGLTDSARKTIGMLQAGLTLESIAHLRRLKMTTIQDHIVEMAFFDQTFSIAPFVGHGIYQMVAQAIEKTNSRKLSMIKEHCPSDVQYFHIRLVLARENV